MTDNLSVEAGGTMHFILFAQKIPFPDLSRFYCGYDRWDMALSFLAGGAFGLFLSIAYTALSTE